MTAVAGRSADSGVMTCAEYLLNIGALAGSIDDARWTLAELAHTAREQGLQDWAEMMGQHPKVRRSPFRVRHWAQVQAFRIAVNGNVPEGLTFSHWETLTTYAARIPPVQLLDAAAEIAAEGGTVEQLRGLLAGLVESPDGKPWQWYGNKAAESARALQKQASAPKALKHAAADWLAVLERMLA